MYHRACFHRFTMLAMKVSEVMVKEVISLTPDDTVGKALSSMYENDVHQIPVISDENVREYKGMVFVKQFLSDPSPMSKLKNFITSTPVLASDDTVVRCTQLIVTTGNRALPVTENSKLAGVISETDLVLTSDFGRAIVDEVMSGAIVIEEDTTLSNALSKMRRYNISRLPIINSKGILTGIINVLDFAKIMAKPRVRAGKAPGIGTVAASRHVKVKDVMRKPTSVERGTKLNSILEKFKEQDEIIVVGSKIPIGIVTPKDALELTLPKLAKPSVHIAHLDDPDARKEIEQQMNNFLKKIQGKLKEIQYVILYIDKHKTHKYSFRARIVSSKGIINAKAVGYDPLSACKELISKFDRMIKSEHSQKIEDRKHRAPTRNIVMKDAMIPGADEEI